MTEVRNAVSLEIEHEEESLSDKLGGDSRLNGKRRDEQGPEEGPEEGKTDSPKCRNTIVTKD
jgi:hypothetical protein